jgi:predicted lipoprotein with Yx(FWY)xxD motif
MKAKNHVILTSAFIIMLFVAACSKKNDNQGTTPKPVEITGVQLTANAKFTNILTDNAGNALYFFADDSGTGSSCDGGCAVVWMPFYKANPTLGTGLSATDFTVITRTDGSKQTAYKGWPLYYYQNDKAAGDVNGDGVGKTWFVAKADYSVMLAAGQLKGNDGLNYLATGTAGDGTSQYLTGVNGRTVYMFTHDLPNTNKFSNNDPTHDANWPIVEAAAVGSVPSTFNVADFSTITVFGKSQLVYKGHPLYYFGLDAATKGNTKGVSFPTPGAAIWQITNATTATAVVAP